MCNSIGNIFRVCIIAGCCLALTMQFFVTFNCNFLTAQDESEVGIWYVDDGTDNCVDWGDDIDPLTKGAQSALTISTIAGFTAGFLVTFEWLVCEVCCAGCVEGLAFALAWMAGGSVFMIYGIPQCGDFENAITNEIENEINNTEDADGSCSWGTDATYMAIANACYLICGIVFCCSPKPDPICKQ